MSAKLLKSLAKGFCTVKNVRNVEVIVYWKDAQHKMRHRVIRAGERVDLLKDASVKQLRASPNLKELFKKGFLSIAHD